MRYLRFLCALCVLCGELAAQSLTTISDTLRNADNSLASGRLVITWPAFKTHDGFTKPPGFLNYTVTSGVVSLPINPTSGSTPSGVLYTVDYLLTSGSGRECWSVPTSGPVTVAAVRATGAQCPPAPTATVNVSQLTPGAANTLISTNTTGSGIEYRTLSGVASETDVTFGAGTITLGIVDPLTLAKGGSGANLSATGGANQIVKQLSAGAAFSVAALVDAEIPSTITRDSESPASGDITGSHSAGYQVANGATVDALTFAAAPTFSTMTAGSALYAGTSGLVSQDNAKFFFDGTAGALKLGPRTGFCSGCGNSLANAAHVASLLNTTDGSATFYVLTEKPNATLIETVGVWGELHTTGTTSVSGALYGGNFGHLHRGSGVVLTSIGVLAAADVHADSIGSVTNLRGLQAQAIARGTGVATAEAQSIYVRGGITDNGDITNLAGVYVDNPLDTSTGAITNNYGLRVKDQTAGTNNWSIKTEGGRVEVGPVSGFTSSVSQAEVDLSLNSLALINKTTASRRSAFTVVNEDNTTNTLAGLEARAVSTHTSGSRALIGAQIEGDNTGAGTASFVYGLGAYGYNRGGPATDVYGAEIAGFNTGSAGAVTNLYGVVGYTSSDGTSGNVGNAYGLFARNRISNTNVTTNAYGVFVESADDTGAGSYTNVWGVKVKDVTACTGDCYAWESGLGHSHYGDEVHIQPPTTQEAAVHIDIAALSSAGQRDSHWLQWTGRAFDTQARQVDWLGQVDVTSNAGASTLRLQSRIDAAAFTDRLTVTDGSVVTATTFVGALTGNASTASALAANGGNCTGNNFALGVDASGVAECAQPAFSNLSGTAANAQLDADLAALGDNITNGLWARTGAGTGSARTITGTANEITVTNGDGVSGNPTLAVHADIARDTEIVGYTLQFASTALAAPADATSYFVGCLPALAPGVAANVRRCYVPKAGAVKHIELVLYTTTGGSAETSTAYFRLNDTTDTTISSGIVNDAAGAARYAADVDVTVAVGDFFEIKWTTPTWATNPANVYLSGSVYIR